MTEEFLTLSIYIYVHIKQIKIEKSADCNFTISPVVFLAVKSLFFSAGKTKISLYNIDLNCLKFNSRVIMLVMHYYYFCKGCTKSTLEVPIFVQAVQKVHLTFQT